MATIQHLKHTQKAGHQYAPDTDHSPDQAADAVIAGVRAVIAKKDAEKAAGTHSPNHEHTGHAAASAGHTLNDYRCIVEVYSDEDQTYTYRDGATGQDESYHVPHAYHIGALCVMPDPCLWREAHNQQIGERPAIEVADLDDLRAHVHALHTARLAK